MAPISRKRQASEDLEFNAKRLERGTKANMVDATKMTMETKAIYDRNATISPFLRLPGEIRNRVYQLALSGRLLHMKYEPPPRSSTRPIWLSDKERRGYLYYFVCRSTESWKERYSKFKALRSDDDDVGASMSCHQGCFEWHSSLGTNNNGTCQESRIDIQLLGVCRQIYNEASLIPFSSNTFSFGYTGDLEDTIRGDLLLKQQLGAIKSLHFRICAVNDLLSSSSYISVNLFRSMKAVQQLHVDIDLLHPLHYKGGDISFLHKKRMNAYIECAENLPLKEAQVILSGIVANLTSTWPRQLVVTRYKGSWPFVHATTFGTKQDEAARLERLLLKDPGKN